MVQGVRRVLLGLSAGTLVSSCVVAGLTDGYARLSAEDKALVSYSSQGLDHARRMQMLSGAELRQRLDSTGLNVVYFWNPACYMPRCVPPLSVEQALKGRARLYVVSRLLTHEVLEQAQRFEVYGIDRYAYRSRYLFRYEDRFINDLTGRDNARQDTLRAYLFRGRQFVRLLDPLHLDL